MATKEQILLEAKRILDEKRCGGKGGKEKERRSRKVELPSGIMPTVKVESPAFILQRLLAEKSAGLFSQRPQISKIGEQQVLMASDGSPIAYGIVQQGAPVCSTNVEQFVEQVDNSVCSKNRGEFEDVEKFYYIPFSLVQAFPIPVVLKKHGSSVDLAVDAADPMVDPQAFINNPEILDIKNAPYEELLLLRGSLIDMVSDDELPSAEIGKIQHAHGLIVQELKERGLMPTKSADATEKAVWSAAFINNLPDSSFLLIESGGKKDGEGKTTPRSLRHFPVKDQNGKVDLPHLRNAIARIPQAKIPGFDAAAQKKLQDKARRMLENAEKSVNKSEGAAVRILKADSSEDTGGAKDERFVFGVVLVPDEVDSQGEIYSADEVKKAAHAYMEKSSGVFKLMHAGQPIDGVRVLETYVTKTEEVHGGETLPVGTWLMAVRVIDDKLWDSVKTGVFTGFSIGGTAIRESLR